MCDGLYRETEPPVIGEAWLSKLCYGDLCFEKFGYIRETERDYIGRHLGARFRKGKEAFPTYEEARLNAVAICEKQLLVAQKSMERALALVAG
jgi:hypothetical protein